MAPIAKALLLTSAGLLLLATALGAYASHGLGGRLDAHAQATLATAIDYHFFHALGLLVTALLADRYPRSRPLVVAAALFIAGIVLFSGSLYVTTLGGPAILGRATPFGGVSFMAAWIALAYAAVRTRRDA